MGGERQTDLDALIETQRAPLFAMTRGRYAQLMFLVIGLDAGLIWILREALPIQPENGGRGCRRNTNHDLRLRRRSRLSRY
jgi:hypothetical protein